jgi:hypothetical protein
MPNWVYNNLTVIGDEAEVDRFVEQVGKPYEVRYRDFRAPADAEPTVEMRDNNGFAFWNIKAPEADILDEYWGVADGKAPANNWYSWNNANWGTKWEAGETDTERHGADHFQVRFHTAWSPPYPVIEEASVQFPTLHFTLEWEEEQGFGAETDFTNGVVEELRSWDIPQSHTDYEERDNPDGCVCAYEDDQNYWFDDCPGKRASTELAVELAELADDVAEMMSL